MPEKLAGHSGAEQALIISRDEDNDLEDRVQKILIAIEGAAEDGICDVSRDEDDLSACVFNSYGADSTEELCLDMFSTLPDMDAPNFLNLLAE
jgi:hypothetical protein